MRALGFDGAPLAWALVPLALLPACAQAQLRTVVSNEIAVSEREATLKLDFQDGDDLEVSFADGQILVDGDTVGTYVRKDALDVAWRELLGDVISLDDGPLAQALNDWTPPQDLEGTEKDVASLLDQTLERSLALPPQSSGPAPSADVTISTPDEQSLLTALLSRTGALGGLAEALGGIPLDRSTIHVGEDVVVRPDQEVRGTLIVVDGDVDLEGTVRGDVVVTGGTVRLMEGGRITGDLRVANGSVEERGGSVGGSVQTLEGNAQPQLDEEAVQNLRRDLEREIRRDLMSSTRSSRSARSNPFSAFFRNVGGTIAGLLENLVTFLVLSVIGVVTVHFAQERLEVVTTTVRRAPVRSAMVGLAGAFLLIPVWLVGMVALAISIVGIPVLLAWVPLFPIVAALAGLLGYLGVARNVGEWVAEQEYRGLEWIRGSNAFYTVVAGVGALLVPCVAVSASRILGIGFLTGLLAFVGSMVTFAAVAVGFGAVLLTRGGRIRPNEAYYDFEDEDWIAEEPTGTTGGSSGPADTAPPSQSPSTSDGEDEHA